MTGTTWRRRHGQAGLLVALLVVAGLVFSYGLGHAPPMRICTEHDLGGPSAIAAPAPERTHEVPRTPPDAPAAAPDAAPASQPSAPYASPTVPMKAPPLSPLDACLCLAVLLTFLVLALASSPGRSRLRLPARNGWALAPPPAGVPSPPSLSSLQVLRL